MRLGKALATGVAEERPQSYESVEPFEGERPLDEPVHEWETTTAQEVPVAR